MLVDDESLKELPPQPAGAKFDAEEQAKYRQFKEARRGAADYMAMEGEFARYLDDVYGRDFRTTYASAGATAEAVVQADMVIGAVLVPGAAAPKLVSREQLSTMKPGAAIVDVAIDQGGCFETSKATTHEDPIYEVDGIMHYCVANMPGAVARTSTLALGNATMPFVLAIADKGWKQACEEDAHLAEGLNVHAGLITNLAVGEGLGREAISAQEALRR